MIYDEHDENRNGQKKKWEKQDKNDKIKLFIIVHCIYWIVT